MSRCIVLAALALSLAACDGDDRLRAEARTVVALHAAIPYGGDLTVRERAVQALAQAVLTDPAVSAARSVCVEGHRALIAQERAQEANAVEIERALAAQPGGEPLPKETVARLNEKLAASEGGLAHARDTLRECESQTRSLELRYGRR